MRKHEAHSSSGMFFFSMGMEFAVAFFARPIAIIALLYLSVGDPLASLFGILFKVMKTILQEKGCHEAHLESRLTCSLSRKHPFVQT